MDAFPFLFPEWIQINSSKNGKMTEQIQRVQAQAMSVKEKEKNVDFRNRTLNRRTVPTVRQGLSI